MAMAERRAQHNAKLADEVMALIISQMREETQEDDSTKEDSADPRRTSGGTQYDVH